jgi:hypothetical protein
VHLATLSTTCLLIDEDPIRIATLLQPLVSRSSTIAVSPLHFLTLLVEDFGRRNERWRENLDHSIVDMEKHIGMTGFDIEELYGDETDGKDDGYEGLTRDLHIANTSLMWLDCTMHYEREMRQWAGAMVGLAETLSGRPMRESEREALEAERRWAQNECDLRRYQTSTLRQRVQTQINIVGLSLILTICMGEPFTDHVMIHSCTAS